MTHDNAKSSDLQSAGKLVLSAVALLAFLIFLFPLVIILVARAYDFWEKVLS